MVWIADALGQTHGLSNAHYGDLSWPKVVHGEQLLRQLVHSHVTRGAGKEDLVERLFDLLSVDTLPKRREGEDWQTYVAQLRNSIFIPRVGGEEVASQPGDEIAAAKSTGQEAGGSHGLYATQKQTIILVDCKGHVTFIERTTFDEQGRETAESSNRRTFEFDIEGWET